MDDGDYAVERSTRASILLRWMREHPLDSLASALATFGAIAILCNALFMQSGPHPAPIFANKPAPVAVAGGQDALLLPRPRPDSRSDLTAVPVRPRADVMAEIQRELAKRGFYDGPADGVYGPKTDSAIRDFEQAAGLRPSAQPNDVLLQTLQRSAVKAKPVVAPPARPDPIAELLSPNRRVIAIQRALADFGYGQIKPTGFIGPETKAAIERFERERQLPLTGQLSERLTRELTAMTGRPLE